MSIQALTQLHACRKKLEQATTEKSGLESDVARLSNECSETATRLRSTEVLYSQLIAFVSSLSCCISL